MTASTPPSAAPVPAGQEITLTDLTAGYRDRAAEKRARRAELAALVAQVRDAAVAYQAAEQGEDRAFRTVSVIARELGSSPPDRDTRPLPPLVRSVYEIVRDVAGDISAGA